MNYNMTRAGGTLRGECLHLREQLPLLLGAKHSLVAIHRHKTCRNPPTQNVSQSTGTKCVAIRRHGLYCIKKPLLLHSGFLSVE